MSKQNTLYNKETTGALMGDEYIILDDVVTIEEAILHLRQDAKNKKNIHYIYILNAVKKLIGVLSIRELLSADNKSRVLKEMRTDITSFDTETDQEDAAKVFRDTDLVSIPVTDDIGHLLGVVHVEDILDVMQQEATEDFHKMATISSRTGVNLLDASVGMLYRKRISWLLILVFINIFSGAGIQFFEDVLTANIALVFFLPLLTDSGGNAGSQSATLVIRAMATEDVNIKDWFKMFVKDISVSFALGLSMALAVSAIGIFRGGLEIALVVGLTMSIVVIVGSLIGLSLPFIFSKLKMDPATASGPLITSIVDITGVLIYFGIASQLLSI